MYLSIQIKYSSNFLRHNESYQTTLSYYMDMAIANTLQFRHCKMTYHMTNVSAKALGNINPAQIGINKLSGLGCQAENVLFMV